MTGPYSPPFAFGALLGLFASFQYLAGIAPEPDDRTNSDGNSDPARIVEGRRAGEERNDNRLKLNLLWCPPGSYKRGSAKPVGGVPNVDKPVVDVTVSRGFWMGQTEVTQSQWTAVMGTAPWKGFSYVKDGPDYPAICVSWDDAVEFCKKLTLQERQSNALDSNWTYRLPTDAEWEFACRAGTTTVYSFGDDESRLGDYTWFHANSWGVAEKYAHRVGQKKANPWGLLDMHGNVSEWCQDEYMRRPPGGKDPIVTVGEEHGARVTRGGSVFSTASHCRSALRSWDDPWVRSVNLGFRIVCSKSASN